MDIRAWKVAIITANRFEENILADLLRYGEVRDVRALRDCATTLSDLDRFAANIIIIAIDKGPFDGLEWVRQLRRAQHSPARKASVFVITDALTMTIAEKCRHAGANAVIGKPLSGAVLMNTIKKVLAKPRPFVEGQEYVGPCRRAGIVTAGPGKFRRQADGVDDKKSSAA
jgi:DNA-binding response OmpR family regulator